MHQIWNTFGWIYDTSVAMAHIALGGVFRRYPGEDVRRTFQRAARSLNVPEEAHSSNGSACGFNVGTTFFARAHGTGHLRVRCRELCSHEFRGAGRVLPFVGISRESRTAVAFLVRSGAL